MAHITCPVCQFSYAASNITNHIRKAHSGEYVSQAAAAAVGLVACACGQVVMSEAALRVHQGVRKCQGTAQPARSQPTLLPATLPPSQPMQPESAPAQLEHPYLSQDLLDPALFAPEDEVMLGDAATDWSQGDMAAESPLALLPQPQLPSPEAEAAPALLTAEAEIQENSQLDASSVQVPEIPAASPSTSTHAPQRSPSPASTVSFPELGDGETLPALPSLSPSPDPIPSADMEDIPDMPEDGIVVLLPGTTEEDSQARPAMLMDTQEDRQSKLQRIPPLAPLDSWDVRVSPDVDSFAVTIFPADLLCVYPPGCIFSLVGHVPDFKDLDTYKEWVYFAEIKVLLRFEPRFKLPFIARLQQPPQGSALAANDFPKALTWGQPRMDISIIVQALEDIGCESVRMSGYGFKIPMDRFVDPAVFSQHPLGATNVYDIGVKVETDHISLVAPKSKKGKYRQYPSMLRVGRGYGSVELQWKHHANGISHFKGYSVFTHLLKATAARAGQAAQPMNVKGIKDQITTLQAWRQGMLAADASLGKGLRLEVTVTAATLQQARVKAEASKWLDPAHVFTEAAGDQQLITHTIKKEDVFADLDALLQLAEKQQVARGQHSKASTQLQRQVVIDLYNAMGWHPGRRPTPLNSESAWWKTSQVALDVAQQLERFNTAAKCKELYAHVQLHLRCQGCHRTGTYHLSGGANQFRLRCSINTCRHCLSAQKFRVHLANLVVRGQLGVDLAALVLDPAQLTFVAVPEEMPLMRLSQQPELSLLSRTTECADMRESMLECLALLMEERSGNPDPIDIRERAVEHLRTYPQPVEHHIGTRSQVAVADCLEKLAERDADLAKAEEIVLLHGVAGAYRIRIAHLELVRRAFTCQVIPLGARGPYFGLVRLANGGYEALTQ